MFYTSEGSNSIFRFIISFINTSTILSVHQALSLPYTLYKYILSHLILINLCELHTVIPILQMRTFKYIFSSFEGRPLILLPWVLVCFFSPQVPMPNKWCNILTMVDSYS